MSKRLKVDYGWSSILINIAYFLLFLVLLGVLAYYYLPLIKKSRAFQRELDAKQLALKQEEERNTQLKREIELLKKDPEYVEKVIRDKLGYAREGETIYRFESLEEQNRKQQEKKKGIQNSEPRREISRKEWQE